MTNQSGGKVAFLNSADFPDNGTLSGFFGISNTRSGTHEFGHMLGLGDITAFGNLMTRGASGRNITSKQFRSALTNTLNRGSNSTSTFYGKRTLNTKVDVLIGEVKE